MLCIKYLAALPEQCPEVLSLIPDLMMRKPEIKEVMELVNDRAMHPNPGFSTSSMTFTLNPNARVPADLRAFGTMVSYPLSSVRQSFL